MGGAGSPGRNPWNAAPTSKAGPHLFRSGPHLHASAWGSSPGWGGGVPAREEETAPRQAEMGSEVPVPGLFFFPKALGFSPPPPPGLGWGVWVWAVQQGLGGGSLLRNITVAASTPPVHPRHVRLLALVPVLKPTAAVLPERLLCAHFTGLRPVYTVPPSPKRGCQPCGFSQRRKTKVQQVPWAKRRAEWGPVPCSRPPVSATDPHSQPPGPFPQADAVPTEPESAPQQPPGGRLSRLVHHLPTAPVSPGSHTWVTSRFPVCTLFLGG